MKCGKATKIILALFLVCIIVFWTGFNFYQKKNNYRETRFLFDTEVYVEAHGWGAVKAAREALDLMAEIDTKLNFYSPDSEISLINEQAGEHPVKVSELTFNAIEQALQIADQTQGIFDPTVGPLVKLWNIEGRTGPQIVPSSQTVRDTLKLVGYEKVILNKEQREVYLPEKGMLLDMGAIAKGYAVEQAVSLIEKYKLTSMIVSAGGNIYASGKKEDGMPWHIGIRDPVQKDKVIGYVKLNGQAIDTAGDYERYFFADGKKYGHIIDPRTGYPAQGSTSSTVLMASPVQADALATATFILGSEQGLKMITEIPGAMAVIISSDGKLVMSPGLDIRQND